MEELVRQRQRQWMFNQRVPRHSHNTEEYFLDIRQFIKAAIGKVFLGRDKTMRCPYRKCKYKGYKSVHVVDNHLYDDTTTGL